MFGMNTKPEEVEPPMEPSVEYVPAPQEEPTINISEVDVEKVIEDDQDAEILKSLQNEAPKEAVVEEPKPLEVKSVSRLNFDEALEEMMSGKKVHKLEWKNLAFYGVMEGDLVHLHKPDGKLYQWTISRADIEGTDYVVVE